MRVVFAGTPPFAAEILQSLLTSSHDVACVYTQPDRPAGRGRKVRPGRVKQLALANDIPVRQPQSLKPETEHGRLAGDNADVMVVAAYGLLLPPSILDTPAHGCINVHASLLPRWRGAAPIQRAILAGDRETGVTIMQMDPGLDTGDMLLKVNCPIEDEDNAQSLHDRLATLGAAALLQVLDQLARGAIAATPQNDADATYAARIEKQEARLDWSLDAEALSRSVRAFNPWPVAYTELNGEGGASASRLRIWAAKAHNESVEDSLPGTVIRAGADGIRVATGDGVLALHRVQLPGSRVMPVVDFLNARRLTPGSRLGDR